MKKIVCVLLGITLVLLNTYVLMNTNHELALDFLYPEDRQVVAFDLHPEVAIVDLIERLEAFSVLNNISIAQIIVFFDLNVNLYMTNIENNPNIRLVRGEYPTGSTHLSNLRFDENNMSQSGQFAFPMSSLDLRIYEMEQVRNIGLSESFHLIGADEVVVSQFVAEFSMYGEVSIDEDVHLSDYIERWMMQSPESSAFTVSIAFSFFALFIGTCFFLLKYRCKLRLEQLWGYSPWPAFLFLPKLFLSFYLVLTLGISMLTVGMLILTSNGYEIGVHLINVLFVALSVGVILWVFLAIGIMLAKKFNAMAMSLKGKSFFEGIQWFAFMVKTVIVVFLLVVALSLASSLQALNHEFDQLSDWQQAEQVYRLVGGTVGDGGGLWGTFIEEDEAGNEVEFLRIIDFERLNKREEAQRDLFFLLEAYKEAFFFEANSFFRIYPENEDESWLYAYELDRLMRAESWVPDLLENREMVDPILLHLVESGIYDIADRRIFISQNYLTRNPIYAVDGRNVLEVLVDDTYTLNVLVPEHYQEFEADLEIYFLQDFYMERVDLVNWYQKELGLPTLDVTEDDLTIHFIYTQLGQSYFSFDRLIGDESALIWDPIVVIHHDDVAVTNVAPRVQNILHFVDDSQGQAFGNVRPFLDEVGAHEIQSVISVFNQGNEALVIPAMADI